MIVLGVSVVSGGPLMVLESAKVAGWTGQHVFLCGRGVAHGLALFSCARVFGG